MNTPTSKPLFSSVPVRTSLGSVLTHNKNHTLVCCFFNLALAGETAREFEHSFRLLSYLVRFVLFAHRSPSDHPGIDNTTQIERFQEKAYIELQDYVTTTYPEDSYRSVAFKLQLAFGCRLFLDRSSLIGAHF